MRNSSIQIMILLGLVVLMGIIGIWIYRIDRPPRVLSQQSVYTNHQFGFGINYPEDWETKWTYVAEYQKASFIATNGGYEFSINFNLFGDMGMTIPEVGKVTIAARPVERKTYDTPDGYDVQVLYCEDTQCSSLFPRYEDGSSQVLFRLTCKTEDKANAEKRACEELFDSITSTFFLLK